MASVVSITSESRRNAEAAPDSTLPNGVNLRSGSRQFLIYFFLLKTSSNIFFGLDAAGARQPHARGFCFFALGFHLSGSMTADRDGEAAPTTLLYSTQNLFLLMVPRFRGITRNFTLVSSCLSRFILIAFAYLYHGAMAAHLLYSTCRTPPRLNKITSLFFGVPDAAGLPRSRRKRSWVLHVSTQWVLLTSC